MDLGKRIGETLGRVVVFTFAAGFGFVVLQGAAAAQGDGLDWSLLLGGNGSDVIKDIALDSDGNIFVTGETNSTGWIPGDSPTIWRDAFVAKLSPSGEPVWAFCLGGDRDDVGTAIAVDSSNNVFVTGYTGSAGWVHGGGDTTLDSVDGFVVKLSNSGQHLWSTYVGGSGIDLMNKIAIAQNGEIIVAGTGNSSNWASGGYDTVFNGYGYDGMVARLSATGAPVWSTYVGGYSSNDVSAIVLDADDNIYLTCNSTYVQGYPYPPNTRFGREDFLVAKLTGSGGHVWSKYAGGTRSDYALGITLDTAGSVIVAGWTTSEDWITSGGFTTAEVVNAFAMKLDNGGQPIWSTYVGGANTWAADVAMGPTGIIYLGGSTITPHWGFGGRDISANGGSDGFVSALTGDGDLFWTSYLGGSQGDSAFSLAFDAAGRLYAAGEAASKNWTTLVSGNMGTAGDINGFVVRMSEVDRVCTGSLGAAITPQAAIDEGAKWRRVGETDWRNSGEVETGVPTGEHALEFKPGVNWAATGNKTILLNPDMTTITQVTYEPTGRLKVTIEPLAAAAAGAQWRRVGTTLWRDSGTSESHAPTEEHIIEFKTTDFWLTPANTNATVTHGGVAESSGTYQPAGALQVTIDTPGIAAWHELWRRVGTTTWRKSGAIEQNLAPGSYTVEFSAFPGHEKPANMEVTIAGGALTARTATYVRDTGTLTVTIGPQEALDEGAQWRLSGETAWRNSGETVTGLPTNYYFVQVKSTANWLAKYGSESISIEKNQTVQMQFNYVPAGRVKVNLGPAAAIAAGARFYTGSQETYASGETVQLEAGTRYIYFTSATGYDKPHSAAVLVKQGETAEITKTYVTAGGHLQINFLLAPANFEGRWRFVGTTPWMEGGKPVYDIPIGNYEVEFKPVADYKTPVKRTVTIGHGLTTNLDTLYLPASGSLKVDIAPAGAVAAGARWRRVGTTPWLASGATEQKVYVGTWDVEFLPVANWTTPANKKVTVVDSQTASVTAAYGAQIGSLQITIQPRSAAVAGARWRRAGTTTWLTSGYKERGLTPGQYTIQFSAGTNWVKPTTQTLTVQGNLNTQWTANYEYVRLEWSTYVGGEVFDDVYGIGVGPSGDVFIAGSTTSDEWLTGGPNTVYGGNGDGFAARMRPDGQIVWLTSVGGAQADWARDIAVAPNGDLYVTGGTRSGGWVKGGADTSLNDPPGTTNGGDAYVLKLSADGKPIWSTYLGSDKIDEGLGIAVDANGNVFVVGRTEGNTWLSAGGASLASTGGSAFIAKYSADGQLLWSKLLGEMNEAWDVAVDKNGNVGVAGWQKGTYSFKEASAAKLSNNGTVLWQRHLIDYYDARGCAFDSAGNLIVVGSANFAFVVDYDAYALKLSPYGYRIWESIMGWIGTDDAWGIAVNELDELFVMGKTSSSVWMSGGPDQTMDGSYDAFVAKLKSNGELVWATCLGGASYENAEDIAVDASGNIYAAGRTNSAGWVTGPDKAFSKGEGFVAKYGAIRNLQLGSLGASGVTLAVTPNDLIGRGLGSGTFERTYYMGSLVTLTAPAMAEGKKFSGWVGDISSYNPKIMLKVTADMTVTATYGRAGIEDSSWILYE